MSLSGNEKPEGSSTRSQSAMSSCGEDPLGEKGQATRLLGPGEPAKQNGSGPVVSAFKQAKLEKEAQKNWDLFYKRNSTNFFRDRHWTTREFEELRSCREFDDQKLTILEAGCGVGNCLFPLLEEDLNIFAYACDFSPRAIEYVKQNPLYDAERCKAFHCDLTQDDLLEHVPAASVDVVTLIFVLSAVHPDKMHLVLQNVYKVLKPGKCVLFRDYGMNDHAMLRFKTGNKLGENFYVRQDGTRAYFFTDEPEALGQISPELHEEWCWLWRLKKAEAEAEGQNLWIWRHSEGALGTKHRDRPQLTGLF